MSIWWTWVVKTRTGLVHMESIGDPGTAKLGHSRSVVGECGADQTIRFFKRKSGIHKHPPYFQGNAFITTCTGEPPIECLPTAIVQRRVPTDPSEWTNEAEGGGDGCDPAGFASAIAFCRYSKSIWTYRTQAFFTIYWANGNVTKAARPFYSRTRTDNYLCT
jgi:hypothetical protein